VPNHSGRKRDRQKDEVPLLALSHDAPSSARLRQVPSGGLPA
jgi:hypothetical protein